MTNSILILFESDKQALALFIQALATIAIGLLAWTAARGQNVIAEKSARKELFKLRYKNIYQQANQLFADCNKITEKYGKITREIKNEKILETKLEAIRQQYSEIQQNFYIEMQANKFLIKPKDYDKLETFCDEYLTHVKDYIYRKKDNESCPNYDVATYYNDHYEKIPQILSSYLYYENESKFSFWIYKINKYLKSHVGLFLRDYFPAFCRILADILFTLALAMGMLYALFEFAKEILKAPITLKNGKPSFELKRKSSYLKRNRPWPL